MARHEADRDDLFAEAIALERRLEGRISQRGQTLVMGFRATGWLSVYLGPDLMYQFDEQGRLRRAFVSGRLFRSHGTTLAVLARQRTAEESTLTRKDLCPDELRELRQRLLADLDPLRIALVENSFLVDRRIPEDDTALPGDITHRLNLVEAVADWLAPAIARRR